MRSFLVVALLISLTPSLAQDNAIDSLSLKYFEVSFMMFNEVDNMSIELFKKMVNGEKVDFTGMIQKTREAISVSEKMQFHQ